MRHELHNKYFHPVTKVLTRLTDLAKEFGLNAGTTAGRLKRRASLSEPLKKVKGVRATKPAKKIAVISRLYNPCTVVLGVSPITGEMQNKHQLAESLGIRPETAKKRILAGTTAKIKVVTPEEKLAKLAKRNAAKAEMAALIAVMDARKLVINA